MPKISELLASDLTQQDRDRMVGVVLEMPTEIRRVRLRDVFTEDDVQLLKDAAAMEDAAQMCSGEDANGVERLLSLAKRIEGLLSLSPK